MEGRFTEEELAIAKSVDLCAVAESLGYTVKKIGKYHTLKEMDSIRIYDRSHWYRWSRQFDKGNNGGSQIDFLRVFGGMSVKEAVFWLLDFAGYRRIESTAKQPLVHQVTKKQQEERKPFVLPQPAGDNSYLISYLNNERGISKAVIELFLKENLIYESRHYHNIVFKGNDKNQQDELNKASSTIARLRDSIEHKDKEMERMRDRIESLEDKIMSAASDDQKVAEKEEKAGPSEVLAATDNKETVKTLADSQAVPPMYNGIPVYYQIPVTDSAGRVIQHLPVERTERKSNGGIAALFARFSFKKKSRADIVKLVASGDLVPAQLVQIKSAIEKGLTEGQLVELINNNVSAEKMKEIIEIAVLENSMAG